MSGTARDDRDIPAHVKESFLSGSYHGGSLDPEEFDAGGVAIARVGSALC